MQMLVENNLAALWRQLDKAEQKLAEANKELRNAERKADRASGVVSNLREEIALEQLRMWGDKPDLAELMASGKNSTMVFYKALEAVAGSRGFYIGGMWADTKQTALRFGLNRSEIGGIERVAAGIRYFAPSMKAIKGGWVRFAVSSRDSGSCAWSLLYSRKRGNARLVREVHCRADKTLDFGTLDEALRYVEANLWVEDVIDAEPAAVLEHAA